MSHASSGALVFHRQRARLKIGVVSLLLVVGLKTGAKRSNASDFERRSASLFSAAALPYSTFFGGSGMDAITSIATDAAGNIYLTGWTESADLPVRNAAQSRFAGSVDAFVAKLDPTGSSLLFCTYLGGSGDDRAYAIAVDPSGSAFITGSTYSADFPVTGSKAQAYLGGGRDAFVAKLGLAGDLQFSTYLGGAGNDAGRAIALDSQGNAYVAGETASWNFPTLHALQTSLRGPQNAFVAALTTTGTILFSSLLGGSGTDGATALALDQAGDVFITGGTTSSDFPVTTGALQRVNRGYENAFVTAFAAGGGALLYSTYIGGSGATVIYPETGLGIDVDSVGQAYVTGVTSSPDFPVHAALAGTLSGAMDAFVLKLNSTGSVLLFSTFLGGSGVDTATALRLGAGGICVGGYTASQDFPLANSASFSSGGSYDAFVSCLSSSGDALTFSTVLGGNASDAGSSLAFGGGTAILAGQTFSDNFPIASAIQSSRYGQSDGFLVRIAGIPAAACSYTLNPASASPNAAGGPGVVTVAAPGGCSWTAFANTPWITIVSAASGVGTGSISYNVAPNPSSVARTGTISAGGQTFSVTQTGAPPSVSLSPTSGSGSSGVFVESVTDPGGPANIAAVVMLVNSSLTGAGGCFLNYSASINSIYLANDAGSAWTGPLLLGSGMSLTNSQCTVSAVGASATVVGGMLTVSLPIAFSPAFAGSKNTWGYASNNSGANSGYQLTGTWTVTRQLWKLGIFNPVQAAFLIDSNGNYSWDGASRDSYFLWGASNHNPAYKVVVGDWNGSGTSKIGIFDPATATWFLDYNGDGIYTPGVDKVFQWGSPNDTPVVGDWNRSGTTKVGTFGPATGLWLLDYNGNFAWDGPGVDKYFAWGSPGDVPVVGDWNGSGAAKVGTFGPGTGLWLLDYNGNFAWDGPGVDKYFAWGSPGDTPVVGDWNGNGAAKVGTFGPNTGLWLLDYNGNFRWDGANVDKYLPWGSPRDTPVVGDWNASGTIKVGTYGPATGLWLLDYNGNFVWDGPGTDKYLPWGSPGDTPLTGK